MTVIEYFLRWIKGAKAAERADAAVALAHAYLRQELSFEERLAAEAALTLLLDDPSPKVRLALSETLSLGHRAPAQVIAALAADQIDVAAPVLVRSPLLSDGDLVDRVAAGDPKVQVLIASRPQLSLPVSAAIAEVGAVEACLELVRNPSARIAGLSYRRMIERHGSHPALRAALAADRRLPPDCRHLLVLRVGEALSTAPFVRALMGASRAEKLAREACANASMTLIDAIDRSEHAALVEHLRLSGDLTLSFLIRAVAHGKLDFFGAVLVSLSGQSEARVRALLAGGRDAALAALLSRAELSPVAHAPVLAALKIWREVAAGKRIAGPQEVSWHMLRALDGDETAEGAALAALLRRIHLDALRSNARREALALAAA